MKKVYALLISVFAIQTSFAQLYFPPTSGSTWDTISPTTLGWCENKIDSLYSYLEAEDSRAFIVLKDGKIVLEEYFNGHDASTPWYWASAGKSLTAFVVGIAQQEGYLDINDASSSYLGQGWTNATAAQEDLITVWNQLTMTTGLDDGVSDPTCFQDSCLNYLADAGTRWAYHNAPYTLLDDVIESATGTTLNSYVTQKVKSPTGMTGIYTMLDNNNVFFSTARSFARFGLLVLNGGAWDGTPVLSDTAYFNDMVNTSQQLNQSYGYLWWLNGKSSFMIPQSQNVFTGSFGPNGPADAFMAMGMNGQILNIVPSQNLVWIRMGSSTEGGLVSATLNNDIWAYINDLECSTTGVDDVYQHDIQVFPNPFTDYVQLQSETEVTYRIFNVLGEVVKTGVASSNQPIQLAELPAGMYVFKGESATGNTQQTIIKR